LHVTLTTFPTGVAIFHVPLEFELPALARRCPKRALPLRAHEHLFRMHARHVLHQAVARPGEEGAGLAPKVAKVL
jgi:hypothetical protein